MGYKFSRREFFNVAWLAALGLFAVKTTQIFWQFSLPRTRKGEFGGVIEIGPISELPPVNDPPVNYPEGKFWLVHTDQGLSALYKVCTHLDCLFNYDDQDGDFVCPCHGSVFEKTGGYISGPAPRSLDCFVVQFVSAEGAVLAETNSQTGAPLPVPGVSKVRIETNDDNAELMTQEIMVQVDTSRKITGSQISA
jgi:nitrite reductase/ring-hydroxylating ferredoxin subunit